jgi:hypothetical protein
VAAGNTRREQEHITIVTDEPGARNHERIRDIRSSEKVFWRKVLDIYATSIA